MSSLRHEKFLFYLILSAVSISCVRESSIDRDPPEMEILSWNPQPTEGTICNTIEQYVFTVSNNDTISLLMLLKDEGGLSELKVDIHNNFDCHGHRSATQDWFLQQIYPLNGTQQEKLIQLPVPTNPTAGAYHFGIQASDLSGNVTDQSLFYSIKILNVADTVPPSLTLMQPTEQKIPVNRGVALPIHLELKDNRNFSEGGNAALSILSRRKNGGNLQTMLNNDLKNIASDTYIFTGEITIPVTWIRDEYELLIFGYDGVRNESNVIVITLDIQ